MNLDIEDKNMCSCDDEFFGELVCTKKIEEPSSRNQQNVSCKRQTDKILAKRIGMYLCEGTGFGMIIYDQQALGPVLQKTQRQTRVLQREFVWFGDKN